MKAISDIIESDFEECERYRVKELVGRTLYMSNIGEPKTTVFEDGSVSEWIPLKFKLNEDGEMCFACIGQGVLKDKLLKIKDVVNGGEVVEGKIVQRQAKKGNKIYYDMV